MQPTPAPRPVLPATVSLAPAPSADGSTLPFTGASSQNPDQAVLLSPTPQEAVASDPGNGSNDAQSILWVIVIAFLAIPGTIMMALIATVLIRR